MTDREIDAAVAREVMGLASVCDAPCYVASYDACRLVEDEMEARLLYDDFLDELWRMVTPLPKNRLMQTTPRQRCLAALAVVRVGKEKA